MDDIYERQKSLTNNIKKYLSAKNIWERTDTHTHFTSHRIFIHKKATKDIVILVDLFAVWWRCKHRLYVGGADVSTGLRLQCLLPVHELFGCWTSHQQVVPSLG